MISIVDYGSGNVCAFSNIYKRLNIPHVVARSRDELRAARKLILPGVGAFDSVMGRLEKSGMRECLDELVLEDKVPVLGVCVGMQIMSDRSEEGERSGLGWIPGVVRKINCGDLRHKPTIPHMGWNAINPQKESCLLHEIDFDRGFYFLHSYYFSCLDESHVLATVDYGGEFPCAVSQDNIYGFQFHPEKSHANGVNLIHNFARL